MADAKISALTNLTAADPTNDMIPIVDVSDTPPASGNTKRISINNILSSSPTASGALTVTGLVTAGSATITGALTAGGNVGFGTTNLTSIGGYNTLKINNATTGAILDLAQGDAYRMRLIGSTAGAIIETAGTNPFFVKVGGLDSFRIDAAGVFNWYDGAGGTRMTLSSTGLGVGDSPSYQLHVAKSQASQTAIYVDNQQNNAAASSALTLSAYGGFWNLSVPRSATFVNPLIFKFGSTPMMTLDASGNLLVGKTATGFGTVGNEVKANGEVFSTQASTSNVASTYHVYSTGAAAYRFYVGMGGTVFATNTTISAISDARFKENVQDIDVGLGAILALKPRKFDWKDGKGKNIKGDRGFIAQEFETVFPNLIDEWKENAPEGEAPYKSVRQDLIPVLVKAIQELAARVQTLETR